MKRKGNLAAMIVAAALTTMAVVSAAANNTISTPNVQTVTSNTTEGIVISPFTVDKTWHDVANNGSATVANTFSINATYGHLKLFLTNLSSQPVTVTLQHNSTLLHYFAVTISGNSTYTWKNFEQGYPQGMRTGQYTLTWSGGGSVVNGTVDGKATNLTTDLPSLGETNGGLVL